MDLDQREHGAFAERVNGERGMQRGERVPERSRFR